MNDQMRAVIEVAENNKMLSATRLLNLYHLLSQCLIYGVPGAVVEVGCNTGFSTRFMRMVMNYCGANRPFHVYDSFEGLSEPTAEDAGTLAGMGKGSLKSREEELLGKFRDFQLEPPAIHKGWVADTLPLWLPDMVCFAHIDVDLYEPTKHSLEAIYPRVRQHGIILVDDYGHPGWPGARRAVDEFATSISEPLNNLYFTKQMSAQYQAFFRREVKKPNYRPATGLYS